MNIGEANRLHILFRALLDGRTPLPGDDDTLEAVAFLAERSVAALGAGPRDIAARWTRQAAPDDQDDDEGVVPPPADDPEHGTDQQRAAIPAASWSPAPLTCFSRACLCPYPLDPSVEAGPTGKQHAPAGWDGEHRPAWMIPTTRPTGDDL